MATEKLAEGIRAFAADAAKLDSSTAPISATALRPHRGLGRARRPLRGARPRLRPARGVRARPAAASTRCRSTAPEVFADLSKNRIDAATLRLLLDLARECGVEARRDAMLRRRADQHHRGPRGAAHGAARAARAAAPFSAEVHEVLDAHARLSPRRCATRAAHAASATSSTSASAAPTSGRRWRCRRSTPSRIRGLRFHFVSNVDGHDIAPVLRRAASPPRRCSSSPPRPSRRRRPWPTRDVARGLVPRRAAAPTSRALRRHHHQRRGGRAEFGITHHLRLLGLGRRPLLAVVRDRPADRARDRRRRTSAHCWPARTRWTSTSRRRRSRATCRCCSACVDVWYRNFHGFTSRSVAPYHQGLKRLPAYLQQLEMETNGKRVDLRRRGRCPSRTSPVVWGEPGTNGQHAYFQMLHQGTDVHPGRVHRRQAADARAADLHTKLLANGLAQRQALMLGKTSGAGAGREGADGVGALDAPTLAGTAASPATARAPRCCWSS